MHALDPALTTIVHAERLVSEVRALGRLIAKSAMLQSSTELMIAFARISAHADIVEQYCDAAHRVVLAARSEEEAACSHS